MSCPVVTFPWVLLQQKYREDGVMTIANVDAVPLYLHCLRRAAPELQLRGLQIWRKLLQNNMANLSAADRYTASHRSCIRLLSCLRLCAFLITEMQS